MDQPISTPEDDLQQAAVQFRQWRLGRVRGQRIPEELWTLACRLAQVHGVSKVSNLLKLDYYRLKRRLAETLGQDATGDIQSDGRAAAFVELGPFPAVAATHCELHCEDRLGSRMVLRWKGPGIPDVARLSHAFWNR